MIFMSVMHCSYSEIMKMPYKTYNKLLTFKAEFEQEKSRAMEQQSKKQASTVNSSRSIGLGGKLS